MNSWKHWCPNGCGKKVIHIGRGKEPLSYECKTCKDRFTRKQIDQYQKNKSI